MVSGKTFQCVERMLCRDSALLVSTKKDGPKLLVNVLSSNSSNRILEGSIVLDIMANETNF